MFSKKKLLQFALAGIVLVNTNMLFSVSEAADDGIHVDQVGYLTNHDKVAMVADAKDKTFEIIDTKTNKVVFTGKLSAPKYDAMSEETLSKADFTNLKIPGTYILKVGNRESYDFEIGDNVYAVPAVQSWRSYTLSRSNTPIDDTDVSGLKLKGGHPQDKEAKVYFTDKLNKKGDVVDVSGGWYDAGDYGKYITTAGLSSAELMLAYEANPDHFTKGQLVFPKGVKSDENLPDVLSEVKFEIDWMRKMQRQDGSTFHKVSGLTWPGFDISPDTDTQPRYIFSTATYSSAIYGASLAVGARVYEPFDKVYAQELKKDAERVWDYLQKTPEPIYRVDEGQENGSGPYNKNTDIEERLWLAAEMFLTTGDKKYEDYFNYLATKYPGRFIVYIGYSDPLAQKIYAASDIFLMPSKFEPCGLGQMIAMRYGTLPLVRETGGLKDTVKPYNAYTNEGTGFSFANYNAHNFKDVMFLAMKTYENKDVWHALIHRAMALDFSWNASAKSYIELYNKLI